MPGSSAMILGLGAAAARLGGRRRARGLCARTGIASPTDPAHQNAQRQTAVDTVIAHAFCRNILYENHRSLTIFILVYLSPRNLQEFVLSICVRRAYGDSREQSSSFGRVPRDSETRWSRDWTPAVFVRWAAIRCDRAVPSLDLRRHGDDGSNKPRGRRRFFCRLGAS